MLRPFIVASFVTVAVSQALLPAAMTSVCLKYADPALVKTLTANLNKDKTVAAQKKRLAAWVPKNFLKKGAKADAKDPIGTPTAALKRCQDFMAHRAALKQFVDFQFKTMITNKIINQTQGKQFKNLFWSVDKTDKNNFTAVCKDFIPKCIALLPKDKQGKAKEEIEKVQVLFASKNKEAAAALLGFKF